MASRTPGHTVSFAADGASLHAPVLDSEVFPAESIMPTAADEEALSTAALNRHLSRRRETAANFKKVAAPAEYRRFHIDPHPLTEDDRSVLAKIRHAVSLRDECLYKRRVPEWLNYSQPTGISDDPAFVPPPYDPFDPKLPPPSNHVAQWQDGVVHVFSSSLAVMRRQSQFKSITLQRFAEQLHTLMGIMNDPECRSFCYRRLMLLEERFNMYLILNDGQERLSQIAVPHRDFYNVHKVDVHVHHSSMANQKHLLRFIKTKVKNHGDEPVLENSDDPSAPPLTLTEVFKSLDLSPHELNVDTLDVHADNSTFHRFDRFNLKYNPFGQSRLREIFMKTDNYIKGKYLAELTLEVLSDLRESKYQNSEYRVSIYGKDIQEWDKMGQWFEDYKIFSDNVRWLIQIPRLYSIYKKIGKLQNFQQMLDNIFNPIFEATIDPSSHPQVHRLLQQIVGFDSVDDESQPQVRVNLGKCGPPESWDGEDNPPYSYYSFYIYSNLAVLNQLRELKGLNTFSYRPHAGEAGDIEHLATSFLLSNGINHGLNLKRSPVLQYLFYLTQIGVAMSPLSNNALFCEYTKNPLPTYFKRGLNVTLSTDDPLQFAFTKEALMEEYSVAAQVWKLSNTDLCELARNSVIQSGFEPCVKAHWLGQYWYRPGQEGNDISKTNVPSIRVRYRHDTLLEELDLVYEGRIPNHIYVLPTFLYHGAVGESSDESEGEENGEVEHLANDMQTARI